MGIYAIESSNIDLFLCENKGKKYFNYKWKTILENKFDTFYIDGDYIILEKDDLFSLYHIPSEKIILEKKDSIFLNKEKDRMTYMLNGNSYIADINNNILFEDDYLYTYILPLTNNTYFAKLKHPYNENRRYCIMDEKGNNLLSAMNIRISNKRKDEVIVFYNNGYWYGLFNLKTRKVITEYSPLILSRETFVVSWWTNKKWDIYNEKGEKVHTISDKDEVTCLHPLGYYCCRNRISSYEKTYTLISKDFKTEFNNIKEISFMKEDWSFENPIMFTLENEIKLKIDESGIFAVNKSF